MSEITTIKVSSTIYAAIRVMAGEYGTGSERAERLSADGYSARDVQECVNMLVDVISRWG